MYRIICTFYINFLSKFKTVYSHSTQGKSVNVLTIDKSQGQDKDCIILLCPPKIGHKHLMANKRRTNVAFTRAKKKLIVVGSMEQITREECVKHFIELMKDNG